MRRKRHSIGNTEERLIIILFSYDINQTFFGLQESFCSCHSWPCSAAWCLPRLIPEEHFPASNPDTLTANIAEFLGLTCLTGSLHSLYLLLGMSTWALPVLLLQMENEEMVLSANFCGPPALWLVEGYKMATCRCSASCLAGKSVRDFSGRDFAASNFPCL